MKWTNFFVRDLHARGTTGHIPADQLRKCIETHAGGEAFHCAFDLVDEQLKCEEPIGDGKFKYHAQSAEILAQFPKSVNEYRGAMKPAMDYVWFDFDSPDGGLLALEDARAFAAWINAAALFFAYSGSKGFHVGVPWSYFGLEPSPHVGEKLNRLAKKLKKTYPTLDTTVFNPSRKFRVLGSKHPKTGLYKLKLHSLLASLDDIKAQAKHRGDLTIAIPPESAPLTHLQDALKSPDSPEAKDAIALDEWTRYRQPDGQRARKECGFLRHCDEHRASLTEPQWYAMASIVGRFRDGRRQFHELSQGHSGYSEAQADEKLTQAMQVSGPRTCTAINQLWDGCAQCPHFQRIKSPIVILEKEVIATEATGFYDLSRGERGITRKPNYNDLLHAFKRDHHYKTIADMRAVYSFNGTHYVDYTQIEIKGFAEQMFAPKPEEKLRNEFYNKVIANEIKRKTFFSEGTENRINFENGILDLESMALIPHSPDFGFRSVLPYKYDPTAVCPTFDWWIRDVMLGDEGLVTILQEFMGYVVSGSEYKYHKALWLSGSGRNGKSTFLSVLKALIGAGNYSTLSIRQIINDKFSSADLDGKIANFSEETSPEELSDSGPFKNLTGDGELIAQKKYGDPYSFRNRAKLIMTYNEVPMLKDLSPGMLSRPIIIPWKKDLTNAAAQDKNLKKKLLAELPGILNFALKGWERLEAQEQFSDSEKSKLELQEVHESSCSVLSWVRDSVRFLPLTSVKIWKPRTLYDAYKHDVGTYAYAEMKFYKRFNAHAKVAERRRRDKKGVEYFALTLGDSVLESGEF